MPGLDLLLWAGIGGEATNTTDSFWLLEDGVSIWLLEDGTSYWELDTGVYGSVLDFSVPANTALIAAVGA